MVNLALVKASPLRAIILFAWLIMLGLAATLVRGVVAPEARDVFAEFTGHFLWVPYLSIASLLWWASETPKERWALVTFTRSLLWMAITSGFVDLVLFGWSGDPTSNITRASPWRFLAYWLVSSLWLVWLRGPRIAGWVNTSGVEADEARG